MLVTLGHARYRRPVNWNTDLNPHLIIAGGTTTGKTNLFRHLITQVSPTASTYLLGGWKEYWDHADQLSLVDDFAFPTNSDDHPELLAHLNHMLRKRLESKKNHKPVFIFISEVEKSLVFEKMDLIPLIEDLWRDGPRVGMHIVLSFYTLLEPYAGIFANSAHVLLGPADINTRERYIPEAPSYSFSDQHPRGTAVFWGVDQNTLFRTTYAPYNRP